MKKVFLALFTFVATCFPLVSLAQEGNVVDAPADGVSTVYVILFVALFFGLIIYFFIHLMHSEKKRKAEEAAALAAKK